MCSSRFRTASETLTTAQRIGSAVGIAVIGTVLFGTVPARPEGPDGLARAFSHSAQLAMLASVGFVVIALPGDRHPTAGAVAALKPWPAPLAPAVLAPSAGVPPARAT